MSEFFCTACVLQLANVHSYQAHLKTKRHHRKANNVGANSTATTTISSTVETPDYTQLLLEKDARIKLLEKNARIKLLEKDTQIKDLQHENEKLKYKLEIAELKENFTEVTNNDNSKNKTINSINITINGFGEENFDYLTDEEKKEYCKEIFKCIPSYLRELHINPDNPENLT